MITGVARKRQRVLVAGLHFIVLATLALQAVVRQFPPTATALPEPDAPEALWWGVWPITYLPGGLFALSAAAVVILIGMLWWRELTTPLRPSPQQGRGEQPPGRSRSWYALVAVSVLLVGAFFAFPIAHTRWGDAYILAKSIAWPDPELRLTRSWQAPLDVFLHSAIWQLVSTRTDWNDATPIYRALSPLAGAIYLLALLMLSANRRFAPDWLTYGLVATLGLMQLFFGYVENYSFAAALVLVYLWLGVRTVQSNRVLWPAATALAFANVLHPSTLVLIPSLAYLAWAALHISDATGNKRWRGIVLQIAVPFAIVYAATWIMMESGAHGLTALFTDDRPGGGDARWLVPLWETSSKWERYTMFSWAHLRDVLNEQLLIAPVVLPSLLLVGVTRLAQRDSSATSTRAAAGGGSATHAGILESERTPPYATPAPPVAKYLAIAFLFYVALTWVWNPDYGGQRDWDLFSLVAIPEALLLVYALARTLAPGRYLVMGAVPLIAVQAIHTSAWIYQNTLPWNWP